MRVPKGLSVQRLFVLILVVLLAACSTAQPTAETPTPMNPLDLVTEAANNIRSANTFRISVDESGPDYTIYTEYAPVYFRRATAQYVSPGVMQAAIRVIAAGIPIDIDVYSRGAEQWYRAIWTANRWIEQAFAQDFNPETLIAENTGFESALKALIDLKYVGEETLESGAQTYHLAATANGPDVAALLGGLIEPVGVVEVDVYVDKTSKQPARFVITEHDSPYAVTPEAGQEAEPVVWTIDIYDINAPAEVATLEEVAGAATTTAEPSNLLSELTPEAEATAEATPESTAEAGS
jgi:hypothetical protein